MSHLRFNGPIESISLVFSECGLNLLFATVVSEQAGDFRLSFLETSMETWMSDFLER